MDITISAKKILLVLAAVALYLSLQSIAARAYEFSLPVNGATPFIYDSVYFVNVNREYNLPSWYSTLLLATSAVLIALIARAHYQKQDHFARRWGFLSVVFLYLSLDEAVALHERLTEPLREAFNVSGYLYFTWVLVGAFLVLLLALLYGRFVWALPRVTRNRFLLAAAVYVGGALVIEVISANQFAANEGTSLLYSALGTLEEFCEMLGTSLFIYSLLRYLADYSGGVRLTFGAAPAQNE